MKIKQLQKNQNKKNKGGVPAVRALAGDAYEVWGDGSKCRDCTLVIVFNKNHKIEKMIIPCVRLTSWDGHPVRKTKTPTFTSAYSRPAGFMDGYQGNPFLCSFDMLYAGQDGDKAVRRTLTNINESLQAGAVLFSTDVSYVNSETGLSLTFPIEYTHAGVNFLADWSASAKILGTHSCFIF